MSALTNRFLANYRVYKEEVGEAVTATIEGVAEDRPCIPTDSPWNRIHAESGGGEEWDETRELQMLVSDLRGVTVDSEIITVDSEIVTADNRNWRLRPNLLVRMSDDIRPASLERWSINNGIAYLTVKFTGTGYSADSKVITVDSESITADTL